MRKFYETVVNYDGLTEGAEPVKIKQQFLFDALSCTEAEASTLVEVQGFVKGQVDVTKVQVSKYTEFVPYNNLLDTARLIAAKNTLDVVLGEELPDNLGYYGVKVNFLEKQESGKVKKMPQHFIVAAVSVENANDTINSHLKGTITDWEVASIAETKIVDVILYKEKA